MKSIRSMLSMLVLSGLAAVCLLTAAHFVEGRLAQQAVRQGMDAKDLTADILPPPMYLIELRLVLGLAVDGMMPVAQAEAERVRLEMVEDGARQVAEAGATMDEIVGQVQRVATLIGEIGSATQEQTSGIGMVSEAVSELDSAMQQNAALVEESAAAAASLREQAAELVCTVSVFRISAQAAAHPPAGGRAGPPERRPSPSRDADPAREPELAAA